MTHNPPVTGATSPRTSPPPRRTTAVLAALALAAALATALPAADAVAAPRAADDAAHRPAPPRISATARAGAAPLRLSTAQHAELLDAAAGASAGTARALRLGSGEKLVPKDVVKDADGTVHTRYERTYRGLPVVGGDLVVHQQGTTRTTTEPTGRISLPTTVASVPAATARKSALASVKEERNDKAKATAAPRLVVWAGGKGEPRLAWQSVVTGVQDDGTPSSVQVLTDATTGEELQHAEQINAGTGQSQYSGRVQIGTVRNGDHYELTDPQRGGHSTYDLTGVGGNGTLVTDTDDQWGDGTVADRQTAAVDAAYGQRETWDFYHDMYGRNGIADNGAGSYSRVHYGTNYANAFWDDGCFCMTYGDGLNNAHPLTELDIAAHEMTHGVTAQTAGLIYEGESGGLNEATSDIMATAVEFYANNPSDTPDYTLGELADVRGTGKPLRYMDQPSKDADPVKGTSQDYWTPQTKSLDVHHSSGVGNHFFYLLSEGSGKKTINGVAYDSPTYDGKPVAGLGLHNATNVWYRALTRYMTSTTDYAAARVATLQAAADLFGKSSEAYETVGNAWAAVNVGPRFVSHIAVVPPSTRNSAVGVPVSRQIVAASSRPGALTYSAANLPKGLSINRTTGLITGTPTAAGTFATVVTIRTSAAETLPVPWTWTVLASGGSHFVNPDRYDIGPWATTESPITVTGRQGNASASVKVGVDVYKGWIGGQIIWLVAPDGTAFLVKDFVWDTGNELHATYTVDASTVAANGTWKLRIQDNTPSFPGNAAVPGYLDDWSLDF
ncbi:M4 family metallopeptidase [Streptomyces sp. NPDC046977]|uniref:M4 family metallopeptidase n=1 Tax=Streptomyces sp. NPDC046977 TaxID=3154703 RepID=UPI0033CBFDB4